MSINFRLLVGAVFAATLSADCESVNIRMACLGLIICSSLSMSPIQLVWRVASEAAMVSASQVLRATIDCRCDDQDIGASFSVSTDPEIDFLVVVSFAKSASQYDLRGSAEGLLLKEIPCVGVCLRYRMRRFRSFQCLVVGLWLARAKELVKNWMSGRVLSVR